MLTTIKGVYDHGKITLKENPPVQTRTEVMVTFLPNEDKADLKGKQKIVLGLLEGKMKLPDDFNEPLDDLKDYM